MKQNHDQSRAYCEELFDNLYKPIESKLLSGNYSFEKYRVDIIEFNEQYNSRAVGPAKWEILEAKRRFLEQEEEKLKQLEGYQAEVAKKDKEIAGLEARSDKKSEALKMLQQQIMQTTQAMNNSLAKMQEQNSQSMLDKQRESKRRDEAQVTMVENLLKRQQKDRDKEMERLMNEKKASDDRNFQETKKHNDEMMRLNEEMQKNRERFEQARLEEMKKIR